MAIKIEILTERKLPSRTEEHIKKILDTVPREHLRGLDRLKVVDSINDPRVRIPQKIQLPGLYHPKQGSQAAWLEVAVGSLLPESQPFFKRLVPRLSFKSNLAAVIFSLIGQHYYLTLRHSIKKNQLEPSVRAYTEKQMRLWGEHQHTLRSRIFKPLQPTLEKWARALQRRAKSEQRKAVR